MHLGAIVCASLLAGPAGAQPKGGDPPYVRALSKGYPGAALYKKESAKYRDERGAPAAWVFATTAPFQSVVDFHRSHAKPEALAETVSEKLYFAITPKLEIKVQKGKKGWTLVYLTYRNEPPPTAREESKGGAGEEGSYAEDEDGGGGEFSAERYGEGGRVGTGGTAPMSMPAPTAGSVPVPGGGSGGMEDEKKRR